MAPEGRTLAALLAPWVLVGCVGPEPGSSPLVVGDLAWFEAEVEPGLEARCATASCHGRPERPLALYAPGMHRLDPGRTYLDEALSPEELLANAQRVAALAHGVPARESLVLQKPLASEAGGCWHGGGDVYAASDDLDYRTLGDWLDARGGEEGGTP